LSLLEKVHLLRLPQHQNHYESYKPQGYHYLLG